MPGRRLPRVIRDHLGPCREPVGLVEKVIEQCGLAKIMHTADLTDFDPLVKVLRLVTDEFTGRGRSMDDPKTRRAWVAAVRRVQEGEAFLEHNEFIPCRGCDQAFEPVAGEELLTLYLAWHRSGRPADFVALHRCPACGGTVPAARTMRYQGDWHTPPPGWVDDDGEWMACLLHHGAWDLEPPQGDGTT